MKKNKNRFLLGFFFGMLAMAVVVGGVGTGLYFANQNTSGKTISEKTSQKLDYINKLIDAKFLNKVNESDLEDGIYKGLLEGLNDPYSVYYTAEEYRKMMEQTSGTYSGIGALVSQNAETGIITVVKAFADAPAAKAGVKNGDIIYKVKGKEVAYGLGRKAVRLAAMLKDTYDAAKAAKAAGDSELLEDLEHSNHFAYGTHTF